MIEENEILIKSEIYAKLQLKEDKKQERIQKIASLVYYTILVLGLALILTLIQM